MGDTIEDALKKLREPRRVKPKSLDGIEPTHNLKSNSHSPSPTHHNTRISHSSRQTHQIQNIQYTTTSTHQSSSSTTSEMKSEELSPPTSSSTNSRYRARSRTGSGETSRDDREHSCESHVHRSGTSTAAAGCEELSVIDNTSRRESLNYDDNSPSGISFGKSLFSRSLRHSSATGATTRKCVLTLDGYSYVIVASTPENRPPREDSTSTGGSSGGGGGSSTTSATNTSERRTAAGAAGPTSSGSVCATSGSTTNERFPYSSSPTGTNSGYSGDGACSTTAAAGGGAGNSLAQSQALNGQVARHGSLTIVRRSNSRKSFSQLDAQQSTNILSPSSVCTTAAPTFHSAATTPTLQSDSASSTVTAAATQQYDNRTKVHDSTAPLSSSSHSSSAISRSVEQQQPQLHYTLRMQTGSATSSASSTTTATTTTSNNSVSNNSSNYQLSTAVDAMTPTMANEGTTPTAASAMGAFDVEGQSGETGADGNGSGNEPTSPSTAPTVDLATENLPAVDTPDACDKAAVRLRCLLRLLNTGEISAEILQKNLHYAARVLEAVFLDETKSPTANKSKMGRNSSLSSIDSDDQPDVGSTRVSEKCNGNCKNFNCSRHCSSSSSNLQNNNNANGSCNSRENNNQQLKNRMASHNQTTSIEGRTKGVSLAPQTHSGPTGPPDIGDPGTGTTAKTYKEEGENATTTANAALAGTDDTQNLGDSRSNSNKATVQRQKRLRTPVWARSISTNKTYSYLVICF